MTDSQSPPLVRPVPRRPFPFSVSIPTPPAFEPAEAVLHAPTYRTATPRCSAAAHFLQAFNHDGPMPATPDSPVLSRSGSSLFNLPLLNLNMNKNVGSGMTSSSTLCGIFSPSVSSMDRFFEDSNPPWGSGSQTPTWRHTVDDATYEVIKKRSNLRYQHAGSAGIEAITKPIPTTNSKARAQMQTQPHSPAPEAKGWFSSMSIALRLALLFVLGAVYGNILLSLHATRAVGPVRQTLDWRYMTLWGSVGVVFGALLPWFDTAWDGIFEDKDDMDEPIVSEPEPAVSDLHSVAASRGADTLKEWTLAIRSIATFVGILFAIRRLPWDSTLQASISLALVNPFLWYVIDRSAPGLVLSSLMGAAGTGVLMGVNPGIMPTPPAPARLVANWSATPFDDDAVAFVWRTASASTVETLVWMLSVLFCCSLCFGNIGRRLALSHATATKGRWQVR
ncbi:hypothetical protein TD95_000401 [Thielaviopsis punctulata]|uniref:Insulin-induced protein n=1 Tax=Thielaviopsis punctulata TaxID=72032 RepID=A0A0F4ZAG7_9PEZI|nr:hypothetical protein TD95_000401 [Thielaviopsis punctulata]